MSIAVGPHLSISGGFEAIAREAHSIGATTFAYFTRNPRGGRAKDVDPADVAAMNEFNRANGFGYLVAHAPYTLNLCSAKEDVREFGRTTLAQDIERLEAVERTYLNFHPGSHVGQGAEEGIRMIAEALCEVGDPGQRTCVLLETMAGKGSEVGRTFEELEQILELVGDAMPLGVCLDTCHVWDGGYDIVADLQGVLDEFDRVIGLERLKALHLNDSKNPLGAHKDRHEKLGQGCIGLDLFAAVVNEPRLRELPMILETPNDLAGYAAEVALLRGLAGEDA